MVPWDPEPPDTFGRMSEPSARVPMLGSLLAMVPPPSRWGFWFGAALVIKLLYFAISLHQHPDARELGSIARCNAECPSYIWPIDSLVETGTYAPDYRMPGYGALYLPLRAAFGKPGAMDALVAVQVLMDALAVMAVAHAVLLLTLSRLAFFVVFALYACGSTVSGFNVFAMSEGPCASVLAFAMYFWARFLRGFGIGPLVLASMMLTWAYFIRPVMVLLPVMVGMALLWMVLWQRRGAWRHLIAFALPVLLAQSAWTLRNLREHGRFFLLTKTAYIDQYNKTTLSSWRFVGTFDDKLSDHGFYCDRHSAPRPMKAPPDTPFPSWIYTDVFSPDSLREIRRLCPLLLADTVPEAEKLRLDERLSGRLDRYAASIRKEHAFRVHVVTPLMRVVRQVIGASGVYNLFEAPFHELRTWQKVVKLFGMAVFKLAHLGGLLFIPWSLWRWRDGLWPFAMVMAYGVFIHAGILGFGDVRYLYPFYPVMCACAGLFLGSFGWWRGQKEADPDRSVPRRP